MTDASTVIENVRRMLNGLMAGLGDLKSTVPVVHLKFLWCLSRGNPIPLWYWSFFRRLVTIFDPGLDRLFPPVQSLRSRGEAIQVEELRPLLNGEVLGEWSLDAATITLLWEILQREKPRLVVECGSGISTLVLARYAASFSEKDPCFVISLEQDCETSRLVDARLHTVNLDAFARVVHSPLNADGTYSLDRFEQVLATIPWRSIDFLLIDGPAGASDCRLGTLPRLRRYCAEIAKWVLDDALRDGELRILDQWSRLTGIEVEGIYPLGKGLGTGSVDRSRFNKKDLHP